MDVIIDDKLSFDEHFEERANKANSIVGAIRRSFEKWIQINTFNVRPNGKYKNSVWNPYKKKYDLIYSTTINKAFA